MRLMAAVADGEPFLGRKTKQGLVFYLCGEGQTGIDRRTRALRLQGYLETDNLLVRSLIPNLLEDSPVTEA
ncbi:MAG: hypothetical protein IPK00_00005, partial [Deltaproteobacteria bacterium]|nr:hypothetical protein [Deltaproteobacteria bacterium]